MLGEKEVDKLLAGGYEQRLAALEKLPAIGSLFFSFLREDQIQAQMGKGWVLCDGREVRGSAYEQLGYGERVPDCRGQFLRSSGGASAPLGERQSHATAVNGLRTSQSEVRLGRIKCHVNQSPGFRTDQGGEHGHKVKYYHYSWGDNRGKHDNERTAAFGNSAVIGDMTKASWEGWISAEGKHDHYIPPHHHGVEIWLESRSYADAQSLAGDSETRPDNITVNTFIRINW